MLYGASNFLISALAYSLTKSLTPLILLRLFHGSGLAAYATSSGANVAAETPGHRRGEALGYFVAAGYLALAIWPALGMIVMRTAGYNILFRVSALAAAPALALSA